MDKWENQMINIVNRNHEIKAMADRLNAISARRHTNKSIINWRKAK